MSTKTLAPSFSNTRSPLFGMSKSILYWSPEQPPPTTFSRIPCPSLFSAAVSSLIFSAARSVIVMPTAIRNTPDAHRVLRKPLRDFPFAFRPLLRLRSRNVKRREGAQAPDFFDHATGHKIDLLRGIETSEAKADRGVSQIFRHPYSAQHVGRRSEERRVGKEGRSRWS